MAARPQTSALPSPLMSGNSIVAQYDGLLFQPPASVKPSDQNRGREERACAVGHAAGDTGDASAADVGFAVAGDVRELERRPVRLHGLPSVGVAERAAGLPPRHERIRAVRSRAVDAGGTAPADAGGRARGGGSARAGGGRATRARGQSARAGDDRTRAATVACRATAPPWSRPRRHRPSSPPGARNGGAACATTGRRTTGARNGGAARAATGRRTTGATARRGTARAATSRGQSAVNPQCRPRQNRRRRLLPSIPRCQRDRPRRPTRRRFRGSSIPRSYNPPSPRAATHNPEAQRSVLSLNRILPAPAQEMRESIARRSRMGAAQVACRLRWSRRHHDRLDTAHRAASPVPVLASGRRAAAP